MPNDALMAASLAYRKNEAAIIAGDVPAKYLRILPHIRGNRILEIGSAEGVLSLLLARDGYGNKQVVIGLEKQPARHASALRLRQEWAGYEFAGEVAFENGAIQDRLDLLNEIDTLVAVRVIYYLGDDLDLVFEKVARKVPNVVLCGNGNRANWWRQGIPNRNDRADNYYASHEGMTDLLLRHGYRIKTVIEEGDPIVVGKR